MRVLAVTPLHVDGPELARRQRRYDRFAPAGVSVRLENLGHGSHIPRALDTPEDITASEAAVIQRFRNIGDPDLFDAYLPDCVLDPGVGRPLEGIDRPLFGLLRMSAHFLAGRGGRVGALARNAAIAAELDRKLVSYGLGLQAGPTAVLGLSVENIADDQTWARAVDATVCDLRADYVINGCSAVDVLTGGGGPLVVDPTALALTLLGVPLHADSPTGSQPVSAADDGDRRTCR